MTSYYMAPATATPAGSDSNSGTIASPWFTTDPFFAKPPAAGDTLYARGGTYVFTSAGTIFEASGTSGNPITICAYPGEVPVFQGIGDTYDFALIGRYTSSYIVIDGITFTNYIPTQTGIIAVGGYGAATSSAHWIIRNCSFSMAVPPGSPYSTIGDHAIYLSTNSEDVLVENCIFFGPSSTWNGATGAGVHIYESDQPAGVNSVIRRCVFDHWQKGIQIWNEYGVSGSITYNTFVNCATNMDLRYHSTLTVRDNAGESGTSYDIYDPNDSADTTADHNWWGDSFNADYSPVTGSGCIGGAYDGTDAGARPYRQSRGAAAII